MKVGIDKGKTLSIKKGKQYIEGNGNVLLSGENERINHKELKKQISEKKKNLTNFPSLYDFQCNLLNLYYRKQNSNNIKRQGCVTYFINEAESFNNISYHFVARLD